MVGRCRLANLVRFAPYPVAAGSCPEFGGAVCVAAMSLVGAHPWGQAALELLEPAVLWRWLPGDAIGPVGAAGMQPASVVADGAWRALVLMPHARRKLETNHQRLALKLYRYLLAGRFEAEPAAS